MSDWKEDSETNKIPMPYAVRMADFLDTESLNLAVSDVIMGAKEKLILISPYLKTCAKIRRYIEGADRNGVNIVFVYGKTNLDEDEIRWLKTLSNVLVCYVENLHAKCYFNDDLAVSTSMNLYEYSQVNNYESGVAIYNNRGDRDMYDALVDYSVMLIKQGKIKYATIKCREEIKKRLMYEKCSLKFDKLPTPIDDFSSVKEEVSPSKEIGFCIRCGKKISVVDDSLFCKACHERWMQWKNANYGEKYCYICGKTSSTSAYRPVCKDCYNGNRELVNSKCSELLRLIK